MMRIVVTGNKDEITGFSLAGVDTVLIENDEDFKEKIDGIIHSEDTGVLVITDRYFELFEKHFSQKIKKKAIPAVIFIPSIDGIHMKKSLKEFVAGVIGIRI
ncbi:V/A-type H+-transporting ATPase subunit F [Persephonella hydrogeniphila]|uniref:V/A-type H+-transporting ATPase subunit F n=1 Tax=Persephonella hydrogeniphila TaxID=198703 RepID=A0A285NI93_9AQUI|nr:V-type ATP synthase subunit F [Persephonella hydrogeniphila]SNZ09165.1 V/A-type H+-transporting ATPase subunit F [Persephonella hydrogeniphila]